MALTRLCVWLYHRVQMGPGRGVWLVIFMAWYWIQNFISDVAKPSTRWIYNLRLHTLSEKHWSSSNLLPISLCVLLDVPGGRGSEGGIRCTYDLIGLCVWLYHPCIIFGFFANLGEFFVSCVETLYDIHVINQLEGHCFYIVSVATQPSHYKL